MFFLDKKTIFFYFLLNFVNNRYKVKEEEKKDSINKVVGNILTFYKDHVEKKELWQKNLEDFKKIFGAHERFQQFKTDEELKPFSLILMGLRIYYATMNQTFSEEAANYVLASSESFDYIKKIENNDIRNMICFSLGCVEAAVLTGDIQREQADDVIRVISEKSPEFLR